MGDVVGFVLALALVASPLSVSAQDDWEGWLEEFYPELAPREPLQAPPREPALEPTPEEPALQLQLDASGAEVAPSPPRTLDGYTLREAELRVQRATAGLGFSTVAFGIGLGMVLAAAAGSICIDIGLSDVPCSPPGWVAPVGWSGMALTAGGLAGTIVSAVRLRTGKQDVRTLRKAEESRPRRVQWDLARSRLVF